GVVDEGASQVTAVLLAAPGLDVRPAPDRDALRSQVRSFDVDGGLVLPAGFDRAVRAGERPPLQLILAGESLATDPAGWMRSGRSRGAPRQSRCR
ncbi:MAG: hypothetical protein WD336_10765, partial [Trueperaceae bacterium]